MKNTQDIGQSSFQDIRSWFRAYSNQFAVAVLSLMLIACTDRQQLPIGAELAINPPERTLSISDRSDAFGNCVFDPDQYIDWPVVIELTDSAGIPIGGHDVRVYLEFSANTFSGTPVMALYDDRRGNENGVIDDFELVSDANDDIAVVKTDRFGGDRELLIRANTSCPYRGEIFVFTQGVTASSVINIVTSSGQ